ncbi:MAG: heme-binding protein [Rhodoferax sp.]|nr:heme-binding protein [Actinomycetota bacterium]
MAEAVSVGQPMNIAVVDDSGRLAVFGGGVLLRDAAGNVAGGVGASAGSVEQDHQVAEAGRAAFTA